MAHLHIRLFTISYVCHFAANNTINHDRVCFFVCSKKYRQKISEIKNQTWTRSFEWGREVEGVEFLDFLSQSWLFPNWLTIVSSSTFNKKCYIS